MSNVLTISENNQTLTTSETLVNVMMVSASTVAAGVTSVNGDTGAVTVQETLVSGTNIKTINSESLLGSGNISITVSPEFLDTVFRIVDSSTGFKASFGTSTFTANREFVLPNFDYTFEAWLLKISNDALGIIFAPNSNNRVALTDGDAKFGKNFRLTWATSSTAGTGSITAMQIYKDASNNLVISSNGLICDLPAYDDDTAAGVAGLVTGQHYQTTGSGASPLNVAGIQMIKQ